MQERKQDTRQKIQWGGLVKKAGLHEEPTAVLLGLLLEAKENLETKDGKVVRERYRLKGDIAFTLPINKRRTEITAAIQIEECRNIQEKKDD